MSIYHNANIHFHSRFSISFQALFELTLNDTVYSDQAEFKFKQ